MNPLQYELLKLHIKITCTNIMADALHGDDGVSYPVALQVPHYPFDPTMHLQKHDMQPCEKSRLTSSTSSA